MFENLKKIRKEKGITVREIADKLGLVTVGAYYKKENGTVPFTLEECKIISNLLKKPIDKIFFEN